MKYFAFALTPAIILSMRDSIALTVVLGTLSCEQSVRSGHETTLSVFRGYASAVGRGAPVELVIGEAGKSSDGWGRPIRVEVASDSCWRLLSMGADGVPGTEDDVGQELGHCGPSVTAPRR